VTGDFLAGKSALVTGAGKRIGRAVALALAEHGANVVVHFGASKDAAEDTAQTIRIMGREAWTVHADLADEAASRVMLQQAIALPDGLDILVNSASIFPESELKSFTYAELDESIRINAWAPMTLSRAFAAQKRRGHIVNFLDTRILDFDARHVAYHLSKRMLFSLTRMMAKDFAPDIQVNAVAPGLVLPPPGKDESYLESLKHTNPLNRYGSLEDITRAVLFLAGSDFVTGQVIYVDGGRHMDGSFYG